jgi:hypothetical protein
MVKEMGDINNLSKDRYQKLNVYDRVGAKVVFKDYEVMLSNYDRKVCEKIIEFKFDKIFAP